LWALDPANPVAVYGGLEDNADPTEILDREIVFFFWRTDKHVVFEHPKLARECFNNLWSESAFPDNKFYLKRREYLIEGI
jgi:hypothetical protein